MKNLQTLASELATSKMQLLVANDMLNVRGGKKGSKKGGSKKSRKGTKKGSRKRSKYNNGCGCGNGHYGYGGY